MIAKKKKISGGYGTVINCKKINVLDSPDEKAPWGCQLLAGDKVFIISASNRKYYEVKVSNAVSGFIPKDNLKVE